ncbi:C-type lectin-like [Saccoglossus kowalevskii]
MCRLGIVGLMTSSFVCLVLSDRLFSPVKNRDDRSNHDSLTTLYVTEHCKRYDVHFDRATWMDAKSTCEKDNGILAVLNTNGIYQDIRKFIIEEGVDDKAIGKGFWFGLDDREKEGTYVWSDGTVLKDGDFTRWAARQPNAAHRENNDCVHLWNRNALLWDDASCFIGKRGYVCQYDMIDCDASDSNTNRTITS